MFSRDTLRRSLDASLAEMATYEDMGPILAMSHPEFKEGLSALLAKRQPAFAQASRLAGEGA